MTYSERSRDLIDRLGRGCEAGEPAAIAALGVFARLSTLALEPDRQPRAARAPEGGELAARIDHTVLRPDATAADVDRLCDEARRHRFASVCVNGVWVARCAERLTGSEVLVCCVVGFPLGAALADVKAYEAGRAVDDGASEIDMVLNIGALKMGDELTVERDIEAVVRAVHARGARVKVILETCLLTGDEKVSACEIARRAGADFVKTSTGFSTSGATAADVALMRGVVGDGIGVKASGGIRDAASVRAMLAAGANRIGASASVEIVTT
ncbi:MAG: deoxyribose-phosphate aldolase [Chlamydiales bacterium]|jgi:deoxyribose-phosphate aldolase